MTIQTNQKQTVTQPDQTAISEMVDEVARRTGLNPESCEMLVGTVLSVLAHEDQTHAKALFAEVPGAFELAQSHDVMAAPNEGSGILGTLLRSIDQKFGEPAQAALNGVEQLTRSGLTVAQMQTAAKVFFSQIGVAAGPATVGNILASAPMLKARLGL